MLLRSQPMLEHCAGFLVADRSQVISFNNTSLAHSVFPIVSDALPI